MDASVRGAPFTCPRVEVDGSGVGLLVEKMDTSPVTGKVGVSAVPPGVEENLLPDRMLVDTCEMAELLVIVMVV